MTGRRAAARRRHRRVKWTLLAAVVVVLAAGAFAGRQKAPESAADAAARPRSARLTPMPRIPTGPIPGLLLIADRGNDRVLLVDNRRRILWRYPSASGAAYPFHFDDDAFFAPGGRSIISNQERQDTVQILGFPSGRLLWRYGHPGVRGSAPGYLDTPDDAYQLPGGVISIADAYNCRVLFLDRAHRVVRTLGRGGTCAHHPPQTLGPVNGATPLPGGGTLVSETAGSWIDAFGPSGRLLWDFQAPVTYPSDPQWLGRGHILLADYTRPGHVDILDTHGHVLWRYGPSSGPGMLDHPSLALRLRPGLIAVNDDYRDRVVLIDIRTRRIVWQYGHTDHSGSAAGYLNTPDGMDLFPAKQALSTPAVRSLLRHTSTATSPTPGPTLRVRVARFHLDSPVERAVAAAWQGRILIAGGLDATGRSAAGVFALEPASGVLRGLGSLPVAFHDAGAAVIGGRLYVFGGGVTTSSDAVQGFDPRTKRGAIVARLPRPLSDLAAAQLAGTVYLVGGYDGHAPSDEIFATRDGRRFTLAARLPSGLRYPAVAAGGSAVYIAGGETSGGLSNAVYAFTPSNRRARLVSRLPLPVAHAAAVLSDNTLYVIGGTTADGATTGKISAIDLSTHSVRTLTVAIPTRADAAVVALGGTTFLIGGRAGGPLDTVLEARAGP